MLSFGPKNTRLFRRRPRPSGIWQARYDPGKRCTLPRQRTLVGYADGCHADSERASTDAAHGDVFQRLVDAAGAVHGVHGPPARPGVQATAGPAHRASLHAATSRRDASPVLRHRPPAPRHVHLVRTCLVLVMRPSPEVEAPLARTPRTPEVRAWNSGTTFQ